MLSPMRLALITLLFVSVCERDETVRAHGASERVWTLTEIGGAAYARPATLNFPEPGRIAGQAPCNSYSATMTAPYPWFDAEQIVTTRMSCPDMAAERVFLEALSSV